MKSVHLKIFLTLSFLIFNFCSKKEKVLESIKNTQLKSNLLDKWQKGYLDIHHINTGVGNTSFFVFPDGTTMLFDAGYLNKEIFEKKYKPLKSTSQKPNDSLPPSKWIAAYIKNVIFNNKELEIDYAIISHFHEDHYASFVGLEKILPFKNIIDRNYPTYNFPLDLKAHLKDNSIFQDYITLINNSNINVESLKAGSDSQIRLLKSKKKYPTFKVRNVKSNATIWTGKNDETFEYFTAKDMLKYYKGGYNENTLSLALKISYGKFDYFTGGDNTGLKGFGLPNWFDVETPIAKAVGKTEVVTLNHHGNRDATNEFFVKTLDPKVVVQQSWCTDHPGQEVYQRLIYKDENVEKRDIFATNIHDETLITYGPWFRNNYKSIQGHIVVRVHPKGEQYEVIILNDKTDKLTVKKKFGPYNSK